MALVKCKECGADISSSAPTCPKCGAPQVVKKAKGCGTVALILIALFVGVPVVLGPFLKQAKEAGVVPAATVSPKQQALAGVKLTETEWKRGGFDTNMILSGTLTNGSKVAVKDIEITCEHYAKSGTKIDSNERTLYEPLAPGGTLKVRDFNMGFIHSQADSSRCGVTDLVVQ